MWGRVTEAFSGVQWGGRGKTGGFGGASAAGSSSGSHLISVPLLRDGEALLS